MAMALKSNSLLKVIAVVVAVILMLLVIRGCSDDGDYDDQGSQEQISETDQSLTLTDDDLEALGIEADTPQDTLATLVGGYKETQRQVVSSQEESKRLREQNEALAEKQRNIDAQIQKAIREDRARQEREQGGDRSALNSLQQQVNTISRKFNSSNANQDEDVPVGMGLDGEGSSSSGKGSNNGQMTWVEPLDAQSSNNSAGSQAGSQGGTNTFATSFGEAASDAGEAIKGGATAAESRVTGEPDKSTVEPVYTVPQNSTFIGSLAMTALLGRVPVDGTVNDPYPFKVVIGKDNLTANGVEIPEVQSAVVSGTATGDWTLSCVRGNITSMTFVFNDGTIRTVPTPDDVNTGGSRNNSRSNSDDSVGGGNSIGWISDSYGIPCVSGMRRSNAQQYLGNQSLITAAGAGAASMLGDDDSSSVTSVGTNGISQSMSGNQAVGQILQQGVSDMSDWVSQLYGEAFAAIYVPPGKEVAIHIDKQLPIDFEHEGRKVRHDRQAADTYELP